MAPERERSEPQLNQGAQRALKELEERGAKRRKLTVLGVISLVLALAVAAIEREPSASPDLQRPPSTAEDGHLRKPGTLPPYSRSGRRANSVERRLKSVARRVNLDKPFDASTDRIQTMIEGLAASMDPEAFSFQCKQAFHARFQPNDIFLPTHLAKFQASYIELIHYITEIQKEEEGGDMYLSRDELVSVRNQLCGSGDFDAEFTEAMQSQLQEMLVSSDLSTAEKYLIFKDYMPFLEATLVRDADTGLIPIDPQIFQVADMPFELKSYGISLDTGQVDKDLLLGFGQSAQDLIVEIERLQPDDRAFYQKYNAVESLVSLIYTGLDRLPNQENQESLDDFLGFSLTAFRDKYAGRK